MKTPDHLSLTLKLQANTVPVTMRAPIAFGWDLYVEIVGHRGCFVFARERHASIMSSAIVETPVVRTSRFGKGKERKCCQGAVHDGLDSSNLFLQ